NLGNNTIPFYLDDVQVIDRSAASVKSKQFDFGSGVVSEYELFQAFPNPFNSSTTIQYKLSTAANVALDLFNMSGQKVCTLVAARQSDGLHSVRWNGMADDGEIVPSGIYIYTLRADDGLQQTVLSRKMLLIK
ncbi:T9SS C-terminal target domain-containing protein, partial [candidate division KSB1 bacterium]